MYSYSQSDWNTKYVYISINCILYFYPTAHSCSKPDCFVILMRGCHFHYIKIHSGPYKNKKVEAIVSADWETTNQVSLPIIKTQVFYHSFPKRLHNFTTFLLMQTFLLHKCMIKSVIKLLIKH